MKKKDLTSHNSILYDARMDKGYWLGISLILHCVALGLAGMYFDVQSPAYWGFCVFAVSFCVSFVIFHWLGAISLGRKDD